MCLICIDIAKGSLTLNEARRNLREMRFTDSIPEEHYAEVIDLLSDKQGEEDLDLIRRFQVDRDIPKP